MAILSKDFRVRPGKKFDFKKCPTIVKAYCRTKKQYQELLEEQVAKLSALQQLHLRVPTTLRRERLFVPRQRHRITRAAAPPLRERGHSKSRKKTDGMRRAGLPAGCYMLPKLSTRSKRKRTRRPA